MSQDPPSGFMAVVCVGASMCWWLSMCVGVLQHMGMRVCRHGSTSAHCHVGMCVQSVCSKKKKEGRSRFKRGAGMTALVCQAHVGIGALTEARVWHNQGRGGRHGDVAKESVVEIHHMSRSY